MGSRNRVGVASPRIKREDCKRTKHDSLFSPWKGLPRSMGFRRHHHHLSLYNPNKLGCMLLEFPKATASPSSLESSLLVLIGPLDWKNHSLGKEGVERYRVHNLPNRTSCSGIYELGICAPKICSGRETSKFDLYQIVPVYIGQADNVRTRLQQYGREGAHLENGKFGNELNDSLLQGPKLFSDIFSRGFYVLYRWAPMKNKNDAGRAEAQLLDTFDYAWNRGSNGARRPEDVHKKLDKIASKNIKFPNIATKLRLFLTKKVGVKIKPCNSNANLEKNNLYSRIFKIGRSRPISVASKSYIDEDHTSICGVSLGQGSVCQKPPIEGRKRCIEHKGMKINGITSRLIKEENFENNICADLENKILFPICGVSLENGAICDKKPVRGRKRCADHKGMRMTRLCKLLVANGDCDEVYESERVKLNKIEISCGVSLSDGTFCTETPVKGRKRCKEHKRMRVTGYKF